MICQPARAAIADSILAGRERMIEPAIEAHLISCADCRAYRAECEALWGALGELPAPHLSTKRARPIR